MRKHIIILAVSFLLSILPHKIYGQYHIIGMNKIQVQSALNADISKGNVISKSVSFTPQGNETWIWTNVKEGLKYIAYFDAYNSVQNCLLVPIDEKHLVLNIKVFNQILTKMNDTSWLTPSNFNGKTCLIVLMPTKRTPSEHGFFIGEVNL